MAFVSNPALLSAAFIEGSAVFILLVLYSLLAPDFPAKFFRFWVTGWSLYFCAEVIRILSLWRGGPEVPAISLWISTIAAAFYLGAVLECVGHGNKIQRLLPIVAIAACVATVLSCAKLPNAYEWTQSLLESSLYLSAGWTLWRAQSRHRGFGWKLLAGALLLQGLHALDRPQWTSQSMGFLGVPFQAMLGIAMGIAMVVLVLEAGHSRMEDLNEKLRRLALITAQATQSLKADEALRGVLLHLVESLNGSHGLIFLMDGSPDLPGVLSLRASAGFSDAYVKQQSRISPDESWVQKVLKRETPFAANRGTSEPALRRWMEAEKFKSIVLVKIPGKEMPLGILGIASAESRTFEGDEENFLVNVANLLGLAVQNVTLFESAATSRRQWLDTFDSIDDLILVHSPDGRLLRANRALAARLGGEPQALHRRFIRDVLGSQDPSWGACPYCDGAAGKPERKDPFFGGYFLASDSAFHDSSGRRMGTIHVLKDFTSRQQAESKFRTLFQKVEERVVTATPEGRLLDFNDAFMRILGYESREELLREELPRFYVDP